MSSVFDRRAEDAVTAALENTVILRQIFCCLPLIDLKECRLVKRTWNYEAVTFMRDFRLCNARISKENPCSDLLALAQVVSEMNIVPIDSMTIELDGSGHSNCELIVNQAQSKILCTLLQTLSLKHLFVSWETAFRPVNCPAGRFVIELLRRKVTELSTLEFRHLPNNFRTYAGLYWVPWLPKLKVLDIGELDRGLDSREFYLKIINAAPNLKKIKGSFFDPEILRILPEDKFSLLDDFWLTIDDDGDEELCLKLAEAAPEMSNLYLTAPRDESERQFMRSYAHVLEKIFSSSRKSLEAFTMASPIFPLDLLSFPPLTSLQCITISTEERTSASHVFHVLRSINYPKLLPALHTIEVDATEDYDPLNPITNPWENRDAAQVVQLHPSITVMDLKIRAGSNLLSFQQLSQIFPNVAHLDADIPRPVNLDSSTSVSGLWEAWRYLESVSLDMYRGALNRNFDAEFLGISHEEIETLREFDEESLQKMNIVPVRPSVLTLLRLRKLKFGFYSSHVQAPINRDQVFLSKYTGILAFKKMAEKGVKVKFVCKDAQAALRLEHLSPFVSLVSEF